MLTKQISSISVKKKNRYFFTLIGLGPQSSLTTFIMIAIIPHKMFSLCKQSLKYNRRIMWNWKTSPPGIKKKFLKNTYCTSAWHYLSNWKLYLTTPQNVKISCNNACLLFQFQFFSKNQIIVIYATCYTKIYTNKHKMTKTDKNHKHMPIICRRPSLV